jgi:glycosyltransferase involved in cell wall biosynthesis
MRIAIYDRWLATLGGGERMCVSLAEHLSQTHDVTFYSATTVSQAAIAQRLHIAPHRVRFEVIRSRALARLLPQFDLFINASQGDLILPRTSRNVMLVYFPVPVTFDAGSTVRSMGGSLLRKLFAVPPPLEAGHGWRYRLYENLIGRHSTSWDARLRGTPDTTATPRQIVRAYDHIWAISRYTAQWVQRYWQRESDILSPIVDVDAFQCVPQTQKRKLILSVGRFFIGNHNKKHLEMIAAFRGMALDGWEFHLAGGSLPQPENQAYLQHVRAAAQGAPIYVHVDATFDDLRALYAQSAMYWHAGGFGEDESHDPIRAEHFGITTVEAMASGCVPIVIDKGGQREIVQHERNGLVWRTLDELKAQTVRAANDTSLRTTLAEQAHIDSRAYDRAHFAARVDELTRTL